MKKSNGSLISIIVLLLSLLSLPQDLYSQDRETRDFGLFENEDILHISLWFDIERFMEEKPEEEYLDARMSIFLSETDSLHEEIRVSARGNYRRRTCEFPPVMLNFKGVETGYSDIDRLKKVKLVSHCMDDEIFRTYVLREYMAYKLYNIVTDHSFRVRLLDIDYYDINYDTLYASKKGFILEPVNNLEDRFGLDEIEDVQVQTDSVINDNILKLSIFQFLIANSDWFVPTIHNLKIFGDEETLSKLIAVPYDFDYTGWVDTHYAIARDDLGLEEIRERAFLGPCRSEQEYREVLNYYLGLKDDFIDTIRDFKYLKGRNRRDLIRYVRSFYKLYRRDEILEICMEPCNK